MATAAAPQPTAEQARHWTTGMKSGFEGREAELGRSIAIVIKTLSNTRPYAHEINDALVKAHLMMMQFAKDRGEFAALAAHDVKTMAPINSRMRAVIAKSGNREQALVAMFDHTACSYQLMLEIHAEPGRRTWKSPYGRVLEAAHRIDQFDLTEPEIHANYTRPRLLGYAETMGVKVRVSDWDDSGLLSCELAD